MESKIGERPALESFRLFGSQKSSVHHAQLEIEIPDRPAVEQALNRFMSSGHQHLYPVIDPVYMQETLEAAYTLAKDPGTCHRQRTAGTCILASLSLCLLLDGHKTFHKLPGTDIYANAAQSYLLQPSQETSFEMLEAAVMLVSTDQPSSLITLTC